MTHLPEGCFWRVKYRLPCPPKEISRDSLMTRKTASSDLVEVPDLDAVVLLSLEQLQQFGDEITGASVSQVQETALGVNEAGGVTGRFVVELCAQVLGYERVEKLVPIASKVQLRIGGCLHKGRERV